MGMFDYYQPHPIVVCPYCGTEIENWQGKDGPCALLVWKQGLITPIQQKADNCRLSDEQIARFNLPAEFVFYPSNTGCRFCPVKGIGHARNQMWEYSTLILPSDAPFHEAVDLRDEKFCSLLWLRKTE